MNQYKQTGQFLPSNTSVRLIGTHVRMVKARIKIFVKSHTPRHFIPMTQLLYFRIKAIRYLGNEVSCPCCGGYLRCFLPFGHNLRLNALCPCGALERHRLLWLYLHNRTNLFNAKLKVLHFAPEQAFQRKLQSCPNLEYITADLNNAAMVQMDIAAIPFPDNSFDVILCSHVLEYVQDDHKAMSELYRVLKPGGWAILLVSQELERANTFEVRSIVDPRERLRLFGEFDHVRIYGQDYPTRLEQAGFSVRQDVYAHELDPSLIQRHGLPENMVIFYCSKSIVAHELKSQQST